MKDVFDWIVFGIFIYTCTDVKVHWRRLWNKNDTGKRKYSSLIIHWNIYIVKPCWYIVFLLLSHVQKKLYHKRS